MTAHTGLPCPSEERLGTERSTGHGHAGGSRPGPRVRGHGRGSFHEQCPERGAHRLGRVGRELSPGDAVDLSGTRRAPDAGWPASCGLDLSVSNTATITLSGGGQAGLQADYCVTEFDPNVVAAPVYGGSFTITTNDGTAAGTVSGNSETANATPSGFPLHLVLTSTAGTGELVGATGTVTFDGYVGPAASTIEGSTTGSFTPHASTTTAPAATTPPSVPAEGTATVANGTAMPATPVSGTASLTG